MKKIIGLLLSFLILIVFSACDLVFSDGGFVGGGSVVNSNYKKVSSLTMTIPETSDPDLYMITYNTGDTLLQKNEPSYGNIFKGTTYKSSYLATMNENTSSEPSEDVYAHYTCGFASKTIRNAYKNSMKSFSSSRTAASPSYDRAKNKAAAKIGDRSYFYTLYTNINTGVETTQSITAYCEYANNDCQIFVENGCYDALDTSSDSWKKIGEKKCVLTPAGAAKLATKFSSIYKAEQALLGEANLDGVPYNNIIETSEKITILVADLGQCPDGSITMGYFYASDLRCDAAQVVAEGGYTNERMMFTINVLEYLAKNGETSLYSTLGHEFNHMINFIVKMLKSNAGYETWLTEMLSATVEDFIPSYLGIENSVQRMRIPYFNILSSRGLVDWNTDDNILFTYGFTYAFGAYLVRNYGGVELIRQMASNNYDGKEAVTQALKACGYNETFDSVFTKFGLVMLNADGRDLKSPTLKKSAAGSIGGYTYYFSSVDLYKFEQIVDVDEIPTYYYNPKWRSDSECKGPCFYFVDSSTGAYSYPNYFYGGSFYITYLGKASNYKHSLAFNAPPANVEAYIYMRD